MIREILTDIINFILKLALPSDNLDEIEQNERSSYVCAISLIFWGFMMCVWINSKNCSSEDDEENGDEEDKNDSNNDSNELEVLPVVNNERLVEFNKFKQDLNISFNIIILFS